MSDADRYDAITTAIKSNAGDDTILSSEELRQALDTLYNSNPQFQNKEGSSQFWSPASYCAFKTITPDVIRFAAQRAKVTIDSNLDDNAIMAISMDAGSAYSQQCSRRR